MRPPHHRGYWHTPPSNAAAKRGEDSWPGSLRSSAATARLPAGHAVAGCDPGGGHAQPV